MNDIDFDDFEEDQDDWWSMHTRWFSGQPHQLEAYLIDIFPTTDTDRRRLPVPAGGAQDKQYTAAFSCHHGEKLYIYRVIYNLDRKLPGKPRNKFREALEWEARKVLYYRQKTKNPLSYLRELRVTAGMRKT